MVLRLNGANLRPHRCTRSSLLLTPRLHALLAPDLEQGERLWRRTHHSLRLQGRRGLVRQVVPPFLNQRQCVLHPRRVLLATREPLLRVPVDGVPGAAPPVELRRPLLEPQRVSLGRVALNHRVRLRNVERTARISKQTTAVAVAVGSGRRGQARVPTAAERRQQEKEAREGGAKSSACGVSGCCSEGQVVPRTAPTRERRVRSTEQQSCFPVWRGLNSMRCGKHAPRAVCGTRCRWCAWCDARCVHVLRSPLGLRAIRSPIQKPRQL